MSGGTASSPAELRSQWSLFWWILGTLTIPVSVPYAIYKFFQSKTPKLALPGKVVVITGASSGLGEALAHVFYESGCKLILAARRRDELERVRMDLMETYTTKPTHPPVVITLDLSELNKIPEKAQQILDIYQTVDVLVNNGGISVRAEVMTTSIDVDLRVMLVNYLGTVAITKALLPTMVENRSGRIVCVSSVQGKMAIPQRSAYAASKHALQAFCDSLRAEMDAYNVQVSIVSPGYIKTALSLNALTGSGGSYGKMDKNTETGSDPYDVAKQIMRAVVRGQPDVTIAPLAPRIALFLRHWCPSLYFWIMAKRAKNASQ